jgi:hypothetical protein
VISIVLPSFGGTISLFGEADFHNIKIREMPSRSHNLNTTVDDNAADWEILGNN